jgi:5-deoxy-5-amino-3-dehydroquinate synthase
VAEHRKVVAGYDLPLALPPGVDPDALVALFARDKKAVGGITFVLDGPAGVEPVRIADETLLRSTLDLLR